MDPDCAGHGGRRRDPCAHRRLQADEGLRLWCGQGLFAIPSPSLVGDCRGRAFERSGVLPDVAPPASVDEGEARVPGRHLRVRGRGGQRRDGQGQRCLGPRRLLQRTRLAILRKTHGHLPPRLASPRGPGRAALPRAPGDPRCKRSPQQDQLAANTEKDGRPRDLGPRRLLHVCCLCLPLAAPGGLPLPAGLRPVPGESLGHGAKARHDVGLRHGGRPRLHRTGVDGRIWRDHPGQLLEQPAPVLLRARRGLGLLAA
mmetsp:Transcript_46610/g.132918  ORF Transcript_46610/g.132918 Transcript_46610/m.132918 type:complete len:257 (-) Transcript_46610:455-1225(-)